MYPTETLSELQKILNYICAKNTLLKITEIARFKCNNHCFIYKWHPDNFSATLCMSLLLMNKRFVLLLVVRIM